jgi:broad specificity phosphatase PhoE
LTAGTIFVVRHAKAGSRYTWDGPGAARPLTAAGTRQAGAIADMIAAHPVSRVVSSPYLRCLQTVAPLGAALGILVEVDDGLAEGSSPRAIQALIATAGQGGLVICSHGDVIGDLLRRVASEGADLDHPRRLEKGSVWVLETRKGRVHRGRYYPPG